MFRTHHKAQGLIAVRIYKFILDITNFFRSFFLNPKNISYLCMMNPANLLQC